ncbi:MAG: hypothetical protein JST16_00415 [Bdellovibrionales bacterium]|nr:hypothetical protein [Bdellovibrionales bacterium]
MKTFMLNTNRYLGVALVLSATSSWADLSSGTNSGVMGTTPTSTSSSNSLSSNSSDTNNEEHDQLLNEQSCKKVIADVKSPWEDILQQELDSNDPNLTPSNVTTSSTSSSDVEKATDGQQQQGGGSGGGGGGQCWRLTLIGTHGPFYGGAPGTERVIKLLMKLGDKYTKNAQGFTDSVSTAAAATGTSDANLQNEASNKAGANWGMAASRYKNCALTAGLLSDTMNGIKNPIQKVGEADIQDCKKDEGCKKKCQDLQKQLAEADTKCLAGAQKLKSKCEQDAQDAEGKIGSNLTIAANATPAINLAPTMNVSNTGDDNKRGIFTEDSAPSSDSSFDGGSYFPTGGSGSVSATSANNAARALAGDASFGDSSSGSSTVAGGKSKKHGLDYEAVGGTAEATGNGSGAVGPQGWLTSDYAPSLPGTAIGTADPNSGKRKGAVYVVNPLVRVREIQKPNGELALVPLTMFELVDRRMKGPDAKRYEILARTSMTLAKGAAERAKNNEGIKNAAAEVDKEKTKSAALLTK